MRRGLLLGAVLGLANAVVVMTLELVQSPHGSFDYGWYSYTPLTHRTAVFVAPNHVLKPWVALLVVVAVFVAVNSAFVAGYHAVQARKRGSG